MAFASLTIFGLYEFNPEIFSTMMVPTQIDKEDVIAEPAGIASEIFEFEE